MLLKVEQLTKQYGSKLALDNVSLSVYQGSIYGLLGPNGAVEKQLLLALF